jgi:hypothetical protein
MLSRLLTLSLVFAAFAPAAGYSASYWPHSGLVEFNHDEFIEQSTPREIINAGKAAIYLPSPLSFTAVIDHSFLRKNAVVEEEKQTFLTAGHPGLINGFQMDERWGTSHASEEAQHYTSPKKAVEGDNVRLGQEDNSLYDGGADSVIYNLLTFWR